MGQAPNETEIRMFFILTISFAIGGLVFGAFANEFLGTSVDVGTPTAGSAMTAIAGLYLMFIPGLCLAFGLPAWFLIMLTMLQIFWIYLLYCVTVRPLIPLT